MFCMRNIHFCHQAEGLELHVRFEQIMKIFCLYRSIKLINQNWAPVAKSAYIYVTLGFFFCKVAGKIPGRGLRFFGLI